MESLHAKNGICIIHDDIWIIHGGTKKIRVCSSTFYDVAAKITVHTVKCTGTHCNFSNATMNYPNAVFCVQGQGERQHEKHAAWKRRVVVRDTQKRKKHETKIRVAIRTSYGKKNLKLTVNSGKPGFWRECRAIRDDTEIGVAELV